MVIEYSYDISRCSAHVLDDIALCTPLVRLPEYLHGTPFVLLVSLAVAVAVADAVDVCVVPRVL